MLCSNAIEEECAATVSINVTIPLLLQQPSIKAIAVKVLPSVVLVKASLPLFHFATDVNDINCFYAGLLMSRGS